MQKFHKKIRLHGDAYAVQGAICSLTICTEGRTPYFQNGELTTACMERLKADAGACGVAVFAYCFMPDHLHFVAAPGAGKDIVRFIGEYKGKTTRLAWGYGVERKLWQTSFYDHFLRKEEALEDVVEYVLNNPVRKGVVSEWREYPYSGSMTFDL